MNKRLKIVILILIFTLAVVLLVIFIENNDKEEYFEYKGVKILKEDYISIQEELPNQLVQVCNLESGDCIILKPIN